MPFTIFYFSTYTNPCEWGGGRPTTQILDILTYKKRAKARFSKWETEMVFSSPLNECVKQPIKTFCFCVCLFEMNITGDYEPQVKTVCISLCYSGDSRGPAQKHFAARGEAANGSMVPLRTKSQYAVLKA